MDGRNDITGKTAMEQVQFLKGQAEWCMDMATRTASARMFERYLELAAAYQQQAFDLERQLAGAV